MIVLLLALLAVAAVFAICLATPVEVALTAPDEGAWVRLSIRHPAIRLDVGVGRSDADAWLTGDPRPPELSAEVVGLPLDADRLWRATRSLSRRGLSAVETWARGGREEAADPGAAAWRGALREAFDAERERFRRSARLDALSFDTVVGTGDPATTGIVSAAIWTASALLPPPFTLTGEAFWGGPRLEVKGTAKGRIFPWPVLAAIVCLGIAAFRARISRWKAAKEDRWRSRTDVAAAPSSRS